MIIVDTILVMQLSPCSIILLQNGLMERPQNETYLEVIVVKHWKQDDSSPKQTFSQHLKKNTSPYIWPMSAEHAIVPCDLKGTLVAKLNIFL